MAVTPPSKTGSVTGSVNESRPLTRRRSSDDTAAAAACNVSPQWAMVRNLFTPSANPFAPPPITRLNMSGQSFAEAYTTPPEVLTFLRGLDPKVVKYSDRKPLIQLITQLLADPKLGLVPLTDNDDKAGRKGNKAPKTWFFSEFLLKPPAQLLEARDQLVLWLISKDRRTPFAGDIHATLEELASARALTKLTGLALKSAIPDPMLRFLRWESKKSLKSNPDPTKADGQILATIGKQGGMSAWLNTPQEDPQAQFDQDRFATLLIAYHFKMNEDPRLKEGEHLPELRDAQGAFDAVAVQQTLDRLYYIYFTWLESMRAKNEPLALLHDRQVYLHDQELGRVTLRLEEAVAFSNATATQVRDEEVSQTKRADIQRELHNRCWGGHPAIQRLFRGTGLESFAKEMFSAELGCWYHIDEEKGRNDAMLEVSWMMKIIHELAPQIELAVEGAPIQLHPLLPPPLKAELVVQHAQPQMPVVVTSLVPVEFTERQLQLPVEVATIDLRPAVVTEGTISVPPSQVATGSTVVLPAPQFATAVPDIEVGTATRPATPVPPAPNPESGTATRPASPAAVGENGQPTRPATPVPPLPPANPATPETQRRYFDRYQKIVNSLAQRAQWHTYAQKLSVTQAAGRVVEAREAFDRVGHQEAFAPQSIRNWLNWIFNGDFTDADWADIKNPNDTHFTHDQLDMLLKAIETQVSAEAVQEVQNERARATGNWQNAAARLVDPTRG